MIMSRKFQIKGKFKVKTQLEELDRIFEQIRKYGVDTEDKGCFYFDFKGNIAIRDMIDEQTKAVVRAFWNHCIDVIEVSEENFDEEDDERVLFTSTAGKPFSIGSFDFNFNEYLAGRPAFADAVDDEDEDMDKDEEDDE